MDRMNPNPLERQFSSPRDMLDKARRDLGRLKDATFTGDKIGAGDAMVDACLTLYSVKDWIAAKYPDKKKTAETFIHQSEAILRCRDIGTAAKHAGIDPQSRSFKQSPVETIEMSHTAVAFAGSAEPMPVLKVRLLKSGVIAPDVIREAIADCERFLASAGIP
jgi:hypothetical protein